MRRGAGGLSALLAGCAGGGGDETEPGGGEETTTEGEVETEEQRWVDRTLRHRCRQPFNEQNFNLFASDAWDGGEDGYLAVPFLWNYTKGELFPLDVKDWELADNQFRATLKDLAWSHNGEPVTAEDWVLNERLSREMVPEDARPPEQLVTGWRAEGSNKKTYVAELNEKANPRVVKFNHTERGGTSIFTYRDSVFADKLEALQDASTSEEKEKIRKEVTEISYYLGEDPPLSGSWNEKQVDVKQQATLELDENSWAYDNFNFKNLQIRFISETVSRPVVFGENRIDAYHGQPPKNVELPDNYLVITNLLMNSVGLTFNYEPPDAEKYTVLNNPKVRQALAWVIDRNKITQNAKYAKTGQPIRKIHGSTDAFVKKMIPETYEKLESYGPGTGDEELSKAESLLKEEGLSKQKEKWTKPDGTPLRFPVNSYPWTRGSGTTTTNQLQQFGIQATHVAKEGSSGVSAFWGSQDYVTFSTQGVYGAPLGMPSAFGDVYGSRGVQNAPAEFEVPWPIGDFESDETKVIKTKELADTSPLMKGEELKEALRKMAWVANYHMLQVQSFLIANGVGLNVNGAWEWPKPHPSGSGRKLHKPEHHPAYGGGKSPARAIGHGVKGLRANPDYQG